MEVRNEMRFKQIALRFGIVRVGLHETRANSKDINKDKTKKGCDDMPFRLNYVYKENILTFSALCSKLK